ncbi:MAG: hypothetical protein HZB26_12335 [Candidatus Hydrogenedentes bacterium]|nr:hypothetical protein [Candidatus Hydrogenedentota bacterium]
MVKNQIAEITRAAQQLGEILARQNEALKERELERDKIQKELWSARKEITTLKRIADDFDTVDQENEVLREQRGQVKTTLHRMLQQVKALAAEYRP